MQTGQGLRSGWQEKDAPKFFSPARPKKMEN